VGIYDLVCLQSIDEGKSQIMTEKIEEFPLVGASVAFTKFVRRQTPESSFSHWTISDEDMLERIQDAALRGDYKDSYRPGVIQVSIWVHPPGEFFTGVIELKEGTKLVGEYKARQPGEEPRKEIHVSRMQSIVPRRIVEKQEAVAVDVILYHHRVLLEKNENETDADWEIIAVNARTTSGPQPIHPMTLMHNHFGSGGGTDTKMTSEEFEAALREGFEYWKNRAMLAPKV
jgi:hypothetical protein